MGSGELDFSSGGSGMDCSDGLLGGLDLGGGGGALVTGGGGTDVSHGKGGTSFVLELVAPESAEYWLYCAPNTAYFAISASAACCCWRRFCCEMICCCCCCCCVSMDCMVMLMLATAGFVMPEIAKKIFDELIKSRLKS